jgi:formamidopyrimidine-DNA glycosylase
MPELPEVETIIRDLNKSRAPKILDARFVDIWTDSQKMIKNPKSFKEFKEKLKGKKIEKIWRRGKNIIFELSQGYFLLIHQKLTGHLLYGRWNMEGGRWKPRKKGSLEEKANAYIHLLFTLNNGKMLALSDLRKFAKVELLTKEELEKELSFLGPEPLEKGFTFEKFKEVLKNKKGKIKQVLMDQKVIAGIGNIYSDEILWEAKINPFRRVSELSGKELKGIYQALKKILKKAIKAKGASMIDFRRILGEKGGFGRLRKVYRKEGEKCGRCGTIIKRAKIGGRSAHYCPKCQR